MLVCERLCMPDDILFISDATDDLSVHQRFGATFFIFCAKEIMKLIGVCVITTYHQSCFHYDQIATLFLNG
jgi:hypothetical protein